MGNRLVDLTGKQFGRLLVINRGPNHIRSSGKIRVQWHCACSCGTKKLVLAENLVGRKTRSCGCLTGDTLANMRWQGHGELSGTYLAHLRADARKRGKAFHLTAEYCWDLFIAQEKRCALTGVPITINPQYKNNQTASLDRIDPKKEYVAGNVRWVHKDVNRLRNKFTDEELYRWCALILSYKENKRA